MHISETQANITPTSTSQTMKANQDVEVANIRRGHAANVSFDVTNYEDDHRRKQTQLNKSKSTSVTINNHQANAVANQEDRQKLLPAASESKKLLLPQQMTMEYRITRHSVPT